MSYLRKIKQYVDNNKDKIVVATGDVSQLQPITPYSNTKEYRAYADEVINIIFPNEIYLNINKILKTQEDHTKLKHMKADMFNEKISVEEDYHTI